jgi:hypothetical protein
VVVSDRPRDSGGYTSRVLRLRRDGSGTESRAVLQGSLADNTLKLGEQSATPMKFLGAYGALNV